ncbi:MAG: small multi-drug export protein [Candidatus Uhrbacteria bacterium]|nr:small multi-drug export protein [Candidatus Uhrbacteria bacterium]
MLDTIINFLGQFPTWLATILLAATPVGELRLAIPVAVYIWTINPLNAFGLAIIGNFLPFFPLYYGLNSLRRVTAKYLPSLTRLIDSSIDRAEGRVKEKYARYGALALFLFTALPLPFTGLWTATLAAVALKVPVRYALIGELLGIIVAGIIVSSVSLSADILF